MGTIQETLLIPSGATVEIEQSVPIIRNPKSTEIMTDFDYNADKFSQAKSSQVGCCLRGVIFDNWVRQFLEQNLQATVIEIGAGLNTRFERVDNGRQVYTGSIWICQRCDSELSFRCQFYRMPTK